jgi:hypothetical protein
LKLFVDRNFPPSIAHCLAPILAIDDHRVISCWDRYKVDPGDIAWMNELGQEGGWSVLTKDLGISRNPAERQEWSRSGLIVFFLLPRWDRMPTIEQAWRLIKRSNEIISAVDAALPGTGFTVPINGALNRIFPGKKKPRR